MTFQGRGKTQWRLWEVKVSAHCSGGATQSLCAALRHTVQGHSLFWNGPEEGGGGAESLWEVLQLLSLCLAGSHQPLKH